MKEWESTHENSQHDAIQEYQQTRNSEVINHINQSGIISNFASIVLPAEQLLLKQENSPQRGSIQHELILVDENDEAYMDRSFVGSIESDDP